jgi:hypothetical protein
MLPSAQSSVNAGNSFFPSFSFVLSYILICRVRQDFFHLNGITCIWLGLVSFACPLVWMIIPCTSSPLLM